MLKVFSVIDELDQELLARVYGLGPVGAEEFVSYLSDVFFRTAGAAYYVWETEGRYVCALRMEPYRDGVVLAGLETAPDCRGMGYATALIRSVLALQKEGLRIYAHIRHGNDISVSVHQHCGFCKIADSARLIDGTVTSHFGTYLREINHTSHD